MRRGPSWLIVGETHPWRKYIIESPPALLSHNHRRKLQLWGTVRIDASLEHWTTRGMKKNEKKWKKSCQQWLLFSSLMKMTRWRRNDGSHPRLTRTMVQNSLNLRQLIVHFSISSGVGKWVSKQMSAAERASKTSSTEQANESAVRVNKQTDEQVVILDHNATVALPRLALTACLPPHRIKISSKSDSLWFSPEGGERHVANRQMDTERTGTGRID